VNISFNSTLNGKGLNWFRVINTQLLYFVKGREEKGRKEKKREEKKREEKGREGS